MARRRKSAAERRKKVTVTKLERFHAGNVTTPYRLMDEIIAAHHPHLADANICIAWAHGWKADADGRLQLGKMKKGSDLDREMHGYDAVMLLNHLAWNAAGFSEAQMRALIDHELCHLQVACDSDGEAKLDENGRTVYRIRKHDLEEFREIVARHGCWKDDVRKFAEAAVEKLEQPLLEGAA